jgi:hypothetical protein
MGRAAACWAVRSLFYLGSLVAAPSASAQRIHHYTFFGQDREHIAIDTAFLNTPALEGAQVAYSWRQLEPQRDVYDFSLIRDDLAFLSARGKRLFVQLQDVSFSPTRVNVPRYLLDDQKYHGGAFKQYQIPDGDETKAVHEGWMLRRWDPAVQERLHKLLSALGKEFDGRIEGINLAETSSVVGTSGRLFPEGFTYERYRDGIITNMRALRKAFPKSVAMQYVNFMPGEWRPVEDKGYLRAVFDSATSMGVGVGGPDVLPYRPGQMGSSYPLIRAAAGRVPIGIAVQDGNFEEKHRTTGKQITLSEILEFATGYLQANYIFWGRQEPYYSSEVVPYLRSGAR